MNFEIISLLTLVIVTAFSIFYFTSRNSDIEFGDTVSKISFIPHISINATTQSEGDLHLSDGTNWIASKALIKQVRVVTSSTDWDLWILQNDNGYATDDAAMPKRQLVDNYNGNLDLGLDLPYQDEDASNEVHLYFVDNSGANTCDIYITGHKLK